MPPAAVEPDAPTTTSALAREAMAKNLAHTASSLTNGHSSASAAAISASVDNKKQPPAPVPALAELDASRLQVFPTTSPKPVPAPDKATDHMLVCNWSAADGWAAPALLPYGPLPLAPTASCLHYATECFEGLKLYRGADNRLRLFRPLLNARRMLLSSLRCSLPGFDPHELVKLILALASLDGAKFLPRRDVDVDSSSASSSSSSSPSAADRDQPDFLYIRPTMIGTDADLGMKKPRAAMLFIVMQAFPRLDDAIVHRPAHPGMSLLASRHDEIRAWPGGFGHAKLGANYGPSLVALEAAKERGFDQVLWLFGHDRQVTEAGASNFFVVWRSKEDSNVLEIVTAGLEDKVILDGVTRRSTIELARERLAGEVKVVERFFTMDEVVDAYNEGRLLEAFAAGTAYFITPITRISYKDQDILIPLHSPSGGKYTSQLKSWLRDVKYGKEAHEWAMIVPE